MEGDPESLPAAGRPSLRVLGRLSEDDVTKVLLVVTEDDVTWPDENRELDAYDVFTFIGIGRDERCLFDLFRSEPAQNQEPLEYSDQVHFGKVYTIVKRPCARCTLCRSCCTRSGAHSLCSHGSFAHLWCRPQRLGDVEVEGYHNGAGLTTRFSYDEIRTELTLIGRQYGITIPDGLNV